MIIYSKHITNRLIFVLDLIFHRMLGVHYTIVNDPAKLPGDTVPLINYSSENIPYSFRIEPHGLLAETGIRHQEIQITDDNNIPVFFANTGADMPFDIFSAVFYLVSRYEEYLPFEADKHGRFPANASVARKYNFLEIPVVNYWVKELIQQLTSFFPGLHISLPVFQYQPSVDIDQAWAIRNKPFIRVAGGLLKNVFKTDWKEYKFRLDVLKGNAPDPFYTIPEWDDIHGSCSEKLKVFILAGKTSRYDMMVSPRNKNWQKMVKTIAGKYQTGLHPSYYSDKQSLKIAREKQLLESLSGRHVYFSRQHFIRLRFPDTYRNLIKTGIQEDYSMAYPDSLGFRAGIAFPFPFYDLEKDTSTGLIIYPFAVMDRTLKDYMGLTPAQAIAKIEKLVTAVRETGGLFISVWHNDSLSDYGEWKDWKDVYLKMLELCRC